ncbi:MAG: hypothetical protein KHX26_06980, partial [Burkholderiales bacterium]|nr:hypothetical protein [Burkholderiales bacterium]
RPQAMASVYLQTIASRELMPENPRLLSSHGKLTKHRHFGAKNQTLRLFFHQTESFSLFSERLSSGFRLYTNVFICPA